MMQQFSTAIPLPNLKRSQRCFWRVKSTGGTQDWSTGSFYSGDTSVSAIGQLDSVGWSANRFVRAAFQPDSGARIIDSRFTISASSAGFSDGNTGAVLVNGVNIITPILGSGHQHPLRRPPVGAAREGCAGGVGSGNGTADRGFPDTRIAGQQRQLPGGQETAPVPFDLFRRHRISPDQQQFVRRASRHYGCASRHGRRGAVDDRHGTAEIPDLHQRT